MTASHSVSCVLILWMLGVAAPAAMGALPGDAAPALTVSERPVAEAGAGAAVADAGAELVEASSIPTDAMTPIPQGAPVRRFARFASPDGVDAALADGTPADGDAAGAGAAGETRLVYENTLSFVFFGPPSNLVTAELADDIATTAAFGCPLDRYTVRVTGDRNNDGTVVGNLTVTTTLYESCPRGATNNPSTPRVIAGTQCHFVISQAEAGGVHDLTCQIPESVVVALRTNFYVGIRFNRGDAGVAMGAPALVGFSIDRFDHPSAACGARLGMFPQAPHSSFYAKVYVREPCGSSFIAYKNTRQNEVNGSPGANARIADDLHLNVDDCNMVALEVTAKGTATGSTLFDLRTCLLNTDAENGCVIPGTRGGIVTTQPNVPTIGRLSFDPPIPITTDGAELWVSFRTSSTVSGPIRTGIPAGTGSTEDFYMRFTNNQWTPQDFSSPLLHAAFDVTIMCAGAPPLGACCDIFLPSDPVCLGGSEAGMLCVMDTECGSNGRCAGDVPCRESAEMNCSTHYGKATVQQQWVEGTTCDANPFPHACGTAACCSPDDTCANLTGSECAALSVPGEAVFWSRENYCETDGLECPFYACLSGEGACTVAHPEGGCADPFCCQEVCEIDPWCCQVEWDRLCVDAAEEACGRREFDECLRGPLEIGSNSSAYFSNSNATRSSNDPVMCCAPAAPDAAVYGTVWFKFVATHPSASIRTCQSDETGDSMVQVFAADDPTDDGTACVSLIPIGCADDSEGCGNHGQHAQVCVNDLTPGLPYYIMVASKTPEAQGLHQIDIVSPCQNELGYVGPDCNLNFTDDCQDIASGVSSDCDYDVVPDECELAAGIAPDCNRNGRHDACEVLDDTADDCNGNKVPDKCDIADGTTPDCNGNGLDDNCEVRDRFEPDCNENNIPDECDIADGTTPDCNGNGLNDACDVRDGLEPDCNENNVPDECDIANGTTPDCNGNGLNDACDVRDRLQPDCNENNIPDECDIADGTTPDCDASGSDDVCDVRDGRAPDCNGNQFPDECDIATRISNDCNEDTIPDECEQRESTLGAAEPGENFGMSTAMTGNLLVIGDPAVDGTGYGRVHIIRRTGGVWTEEPGFLSNHTDFGGTVATDGVRVMVSSVRESRSDGTGRVRLFTPSGFNWEQTITLEPERWPSVYLFGHAMAVDSGTLLIGAQAFTGAPYIVCVGFPYRWDGVLWYPETILSTGEPCNLSRSDSTVAIGGNSALVAAEAAERDGWAEAGVVDVFRRRGTWAFEARLESGNPMEFTRFGHCVAIEGDVALIGALGRTTANDQTTDDCVFVFRRDDDRWVEDGRLPVPPTPRAERELSLSYRSSLAVVGRVAGGTYASVFQRQGGQWVETQQLAAPEMTSPETTRSPQATNGDDAAVVWVRGSDGAEGKETLAAGSLLFPIWDVDCNHNQSPDLCETLEESPGDCNRNRVPDECEHGAAGDYDIDGDVDAADVKQLPKCLTGPGATDVPPCCLPLDSDKSGTIDLRDMSAVFVEFTGD